MELTETYTLYGNSEPRKLSVHHDPVDGVARVSIVDDNCMLSFDLTRDQARQVIAELQKLTYVDFKIGDVVYWQDPEPSMACSGEYTISDITGTLDDLTIWLDNDSLPVSTHEIILVKSHLT